MNSTTTNPRPDGSLHSTLYTSPVGELTIVASDDGLRAVLWPRDDDRRVPLSGEVVTSEHHPILDRAVTELDEYFAGDRRAFDVPVDATGTAFQRQAWLALRSIPFGETVSYGEQAARMGDRNKARAVGAANGKNPISIIVPCHRVVGAGGSLTGFAGGLETKQWLLAHEQRVVGATLL